MKFSDRFFRVKASYRYSFILSLAAHSVLGLVLVFISVNPISRGRNGSAENAALLKKALGALAIPGQEADQIIRKMDSAEIDFDPRIKAAQKLEIMNAFIKSIINLAEGKKGTYLDLEKIPMNEIISNPEFLNGLKMGSGDRAFATTSNLGKERIRFEKLYQGDLEKLTNTLTNEKAEKENVSINRGTIDVDQHHEERGRFSRSSDTAFKIPEQYYFRKSPYDKIIASGTKLFSIDGDFRNLSTAFEKNELDPIRSREIMNPYRAAESDLTNIVFIDLKVKAKKQLPKKRPDLLLTGFEINKILDDLMQLPEKQQFERLRREYLDKYKADSACLAELTESFFEKNINGLFFEVNSLSVAFDYLEELYYKREIYDYLPRYCRDNPATKTGALLLLYQAASYDFEKRTLLNLSYAYEGASDLCNKGYVLNNLFNSRTKAFVVKRTYEQIRDFMKERRIKSIKDLCDRYSEQQRRIFDVLVNAGGEYRDRGLFALGKLTWDEGNYQIAIETWKKIGRLASIEPFQRMKPYLGNDVDKKTQIEKIKNVFISLEISGENKRHLARLVKFNKWKLRAGS
jgi:hypothetical protein